MKVIYCRCNGGEYYLPNQYGGHCPIDGWSSPENQELGRAVDQLLKASEDVSIAGLRRLGTSEAAIARAIVIEFGSEQSSFELIAPRGYVVGGEWVPSESADRRRFR